MIESKGILEFYKDNFAIAFRFYINDEFNLFIGHRITKFCYEFVSWNDKNYKIYKNGERIQ